MASARSHYGNVFFPQMSVVFSSGRIREGVVSGESWEASVLDVFDQWAGVLGIRKSAAAVYGLLYCSPEALAAEEIRARLKLSRGATVEALQFLRRSGAVRVHLKIGDRRDYFSAETDLRALAREFSKGVLEPWLEKAGMRIAQARECAAVSDAFARSRTEGLARAQREVCAFAEAVRRGLLPRGAPSVSHRRFFFGRLCGIRGALRDLVGGSGIR